ncbi:MULTISPECIES: response regulator [Microbacterium]|uniref:response regulator n=1 Tax=Microbacterium TaxID=33882 RepID=UPI0010F93BAF|nr:response regulator [Microbacterium sp. 4NA327F11]MCK9916762.1 response regulator [Microbacteriaceae bacterium K1510]
MNVLRVLIVDDVPAVASLHARFVDAHGGCQVVGTAATGPEAVRLVRDLAPDLVLLDVFLPGFTGLEALRVLRSDGTIVQPEVIAVTAARDVDTVRAARMRGARHYLVKPFTADDLHARIDDVLAERRVPRSVRPGLDQDSVDALMRPGARRQLPKGLSAPTLLVVRSALAEAGEASAAEIADLAGLSRVSCRRYLEHLADSGTATRSLDYGTAGRPRTRYRIAAESRCSGPVAASPQR